MAPSPFAAWAIFYQTTGSSAAALTGLMFIVVTLAANRPRTTSEDVQSMQEGFSVFSTPTMVHLSTAFLISAGLTAPWQSVAPMAVLLVLGAIVGIAYTFRIHLRVRTITAYAAQIDDWIWYSILPQAAYVLLALGAIALFWWPNVASIVLAADTLLLIVIGIHNAWDIVTYIGMSSADR